MRKEKSSRSLLNLLEKWIEFVPFALLLILLTHWLNKQKLHDLNLLHEVGNSGFSPAAAAVTQLCREGKLSGEKSILCGKNLMGANWQSVVLPKANLTGIDLSYGNLQSAFLENSDLTKAIFRDANLSHANLRGARLFHANFMAAKLTGAVLIGARAKGASFFMTRAVRGKMMGINLERADLQEADLHGTSLQRSYLAHAHMRDTNLAEANLEHAFLHGAFLVNANLSGAHLANAQFNELTVLPDAQFIDFENGRAIHDKYWTAETDMSRYTDPTHPNFWQPKWAQSDRVKRNYEEP